MDTHSPSSWRELADLEARNRAAEQLSTLSEESGDANNSSEDDDVTVDRESDAVPRVAK